MAPSQNPPVAMAAIPQGSVRQVVVKRLLDPLGPWTGVAVQFTLVALTVHDRREQGESETRRC